MDSTQSSKQGPQIKIIVEPDVGQGRFSNMANISHSGEEFTFDYLYVNPSPPPFGKMVSRVVMTPGHAKRFLQALQENVAKYEQKFGAIGASTPPDKEAIN